MVDGASGAGVAASTGQISEGGLVMRNEITSWLLEQQKPS